MLFLRCAARLKRYKYERIIIQLFCIKIHFDFFTNKTKSPFENGKAFLFLLYFHCAICLVVCCFFKHVYGKSAVAKGNAEFFEIGKFGYGHFL